MHFKNSSAYLLFFLITLLLSICLLFLPACNHIPADQSLNDSSESTSDGLAYPANSENDIDTSIIDLNDNNQNNENTGLNEIPYIGIYGGIGTWDINVKAFINFFDYYDYPWILINENDIVNGEFISKVDAVVFPGGFAAEYKNLIPDHSHLINFVEEGGIFIGVCAGAYYASHTLTWYGVDYKYPLAFYEGRGIGPLAGSVNWGDIAEFALTPGHPANEGFDHTLELYYFDGPYFKLEETDSAEVLAIYAVNSQPAVIAGRFGKGKYLLFGPHPELGGYSSQSPDFNLQGEEGAQWPWLESSLGWLFSW